MPSPAVPRARLGPTSEPSSALVAGPVGRLEFAELARRILKVLNEPKRLAILYALVGRSATVGELSRLIGASRSNTSQHLAVLRAQGMVDAKRHSHNVVYSLGHPKVIAAIELLRQVMLEESSRRASLHSLAPEALACPGASPGDASHGDASPGASPPPLGSKPRRLGQGATSCRSR